MKMNKGDTLIQNDETHFIILIVAMPLQMVEVYRMWDFQYSRMRIRMRILHFNIRGYRMRMRILYILLY